MTQNANSPTDPNAAQPTPSSVMPTTPSATPTQQQLQQYNAQAGSTGHTNFGGPTRLKPQPGSKKAPTIPQSPQGSPDSDEEPGDNPLPQKAKDKAEEEAKSIKRSGGLLLAVVVLILLIWLLIPTASGYTRLQLLWFTLIGKTDLATDAAFTNTLPGLTDLNSQTNAFGTQSNNQQPLSNNQQPNIQQTQPWSSSPGTTITQGAGPSGFSNDDMNFLFQSGLGL